jgi:hypothetical protein
MKLSSNKLTRRQWIKLSAAAAAAAAGGLTYGYAVSERVQLSRVAVKLAALPAAFEGLTIAHLSDIHHGPYTDLDYIRRCVELVNAAQPDLVALTGDFVLRSRNYIEPCAEVLSELKPRIGNYAVLGNHDYYQGAGFLARALHRTGCTLLVDERERLEHRGERLSLLGVDDLYYGQTDIPRLLRDVPVDEAKIVLAHNPDFIEEFALKGRHLDLMLSGHTHGGQVRLPLLGAPHVDSAYGQQYVVGMNRKALNDGKTMQVYTTRGIGTILLPVRFDCPPEIVFYTLQRA